MKILNTEQIRAVDTYTIAHEPIASINLMERAANACVKWINAHFNKDVHVIIVCGMGNNGGDGLAIGRLMSDQGYNVEIVIAPFFSKASPDFQANRKRLEGRTGMNVSEIKEASDISLHKEQPAVIIDAILGTGISKPVDGKLAEVIQRINSLHCPVVAIDVPSGLMTEDNSKNDHKSIINANATLTFELPKLAFMFAENAKHVGDFYLLHIGLNQAIIAEQKSNNYFVTREMVAPLLRTRDKFSHKGTFGHALLVAGSYGKMGAAVLASKACLKAGAGLVTTHIPKCGCEILQTAVPEAMAAVDEEEKEFSGIKDVSKFNVIGIGPGIGTDKQTQQGVKLLIQSKVPMVIDADALNILAENKTWLEFLPKGSILTPHPGEFARLAGKTTTGYDAYTLQREFAIKYKVYVVLKGAHTSISTPTGDVYFNSTGNPYMATAGSGDTLTGIITGLLAQGYPSVQAALIGVYLHGLAGDIATHELGTILASDITNYLGKAFTEVKA